MEVRLILTLLNGLLSGSLRKPLGISKFMFLPLLYIFCYLIQGGTLPAQFFLQHLITSVIFLLFAVVLQVAQRRDFFETNPGRNHAPHVRVAERASGHRPAPGDGETTPRPLRGKNYGRIWTI